jgi:DNA-formamidopyrimidine glycosylase
MPELPEVETVRRMLESAIVDRRVASASVSRKRLRTTSLASLPGRLVGRTFRTPRRTGKFLMLDMDGGVTLLSHLGMSGRWLYWRPGWTPDGSLEHVHLKLSFEDGAVLWFLDVRRFGMLRVVATERLAQDSSLRLLGPDPLAVPRDGAALRTAARGARTSIKVWLLDQRRIAGLGNIYASEVLFRARGERDPRRARGEHRAHGHDVLDLPHDLERAGRVRRAAARLRSRRRAVPQLRNAAQAHRAGWQVHLFLPELPAPRRFFAPRSRPRTPRSARSGAAFVESLTAHLPPPVISTYMAKHHVS